MCVFIDVKTMSLVIGPHRRCLPDGVMIGTASALDAAPKELLYPSSRLSMNRNVYILLT